MTTSIQDEPAVGSGAMGDNTDGVPSRINGARQPPLRWSERRLAELKHLATGLSKPGHSIEPTLATALLHAAAGDFDQAESIILQVLQGFPEPGRVGEAAFHPLLSALFVVMRLDLASRLLCERYEPGCVVDIEITEQGVGRHQFIWDVMLPERMKFTFNQSLVTEDNTRGQISWFDWIFPLFAAYAKNWPGERGSVTFNQWDAGLSPGLAMCDNRRGFFLVPCNAFTRTHGYEEARQYFTQHNVRWEERRSVAFWRGATTGAMEDPSRGWRSLPRVRLCEIGQAHADLMDVGISAIVQAEDRAATEEIQQSGIVKPFVPWNEFQRFKYQIDIDGNTNSWPGLFQKLLTGSPVLKVASPHGFRQWYYDRLKPWINFVPVESGMSDLVAKIRWLIAHDDAARQIGELGQALALSMDFAGELKRAVPTITAALRYFAGRPETELRFGSGRADNAYLREGWLDAEAQGVPAGGIESLIELPRPVATEDFVLALELSPTTLAPTRSAQRVTVVANGEVLRHVMLSKPQALECMLLRRTIDVAEMLSVRLLHPDATTTASESHPLDTRACSITLHRLTLTAATVYAASGRITPMLGIMTPPLPTPHPDTAESKLRYGPDIWLHPDKELRQIMTHNGHVVFVDTSMGQLLHGAPSSCPRNVFLAICGATGYLLHIAADGQRRSIHVTAEPPRHPPDVMTASLDQWIQAFRLVEVAGAEPAGFALSCDGLFLCAEPNGQVTLSRPRLGLWERFHLGEPPASQDKSGGPVSTERP